MADIDEVKKDVVVSGVKELDDKLGGGIPFGSLGLIEGHSDAGKSVLSQHLTYGALTQSQGSVAYYTTENTIKSMIAQMDSLSLFTLDHFLTDHFRIYPLTLGSRIKNAEKPYHQLIRHFKSLPPEFRLIIVDSITLLVTHSNPVSIVDFFSACKNICDNGRAIILVAHSYAFDEEILSRTRSLCDAHLKLRLEQVGDRMVKILEVLKIRGADRQTGDVVSFEIEPRTGIRIIPLAKARI
jgi:archaeal flagellar protein FlaH